MHVSARVQKCGQTLGNTVFQDTDASTVNSAFSEFSKLTAFLEADQLDIRTAAGEALAFLYELGSETRPGFRLANHQQIVDVRSSYIIR